MKLYKRRTKHSEELGMSKMTSSLSTALELNLGMALLLNLSHLKHESAISRNAMLTTKHH